MPVRSLHPLLGDISAEERKGTVMKKSIPSLVSALALAALLGPPAALGADSPENRPEGTKEEIAKQAPKAEDFVTQAGQGGMAEVTLGQLADTKGANA
jgi:hypothetical protein